MIREIAIEPELLTEWSKKEYRREFNPSQLRRQYGYGSPKRMSRYPKRWRQLIGRLLADIQEPLQRKRIEELATALLENSVRRFEYHWEGEKSWYENALEEHARVPFEAILCRANFQASDIAISFQDHIDENEDKLNLLNIPHGLAPVRTTEALINTIGPWLFHCKSIIIVDPYFDPNRLQFREPLIQLVSDVLTNCTVENYPFFEIVRKYNDNAPTIEHLRAGFEQHIVQNLPDEFKVCFSVLDEKRGGEKLHQRYILSETGGVRIDPGFDVQDDLNGSETYDINLLSEDQYALRWEQYYTSNDAFDLMGSQLIVTNQGITEN